MGRSYELKMGKQTGYAVARARKIAAEARLAELTLAEREGELVPVAEVTKVEAAFLAELRARIIATPGRWAPRLVGLRTTAAAQGRAEEIVDELLEVLQGSGEALRDRLLAPEAAPRERGRGR